MLSFFLNRWKGEKGLKILATHVTKEIMAEAANMVKNEQYTIILLGV